MPFDTFIVAGFFFVGTVIGAACVASSKKYKWLHVVPFLYSCLVEFALAVFQDRSFNWGGALFFGAAYYVLGWLALLSARSYERRRHGN